MALTIKMTEEKKHHQNWGVKIGMVLAILVLLGNSWMIWQMRSVVDRVDKYNQGVVDEIGGMTGDVKDFAGDLNEIRRFLLLPEKSYAVIGQSDSGDATLSPEAETNMALFAALDSISKEKKNAEKEAAALVTFNDLIKDPVFLNSVSATKLAVGEKGQLQVKFNDALDKNLDGSANVLLGQPLFNLVFDAGKNVFKLQSALGEQELVVGENSSLEAEIIQYMLKNTGAVRDKKMESAKQAEADKQKASTQAVQDLQNRKNVLDNLINDKAFQDTLLADGWQLVVPAREEANKYIYDLKDAQGKVGFSLAVELSSGMIKVMRNGQEDDVKSFLNTEGSKKKT